MYTCNIRTLRRRVLYEKSCMAEMESMHHILQVALYHYSIFGCRFASESL